MSNPDATSANDVPSRLATASLMAVRAMMRVIRGYQVNPRGVLDGQTKADETIVTRVDRESGAAAEEVYLQVTPDLQRHDEETGTSGVLGGTHTAKNDPVDGTSSLVEGAACETAISGWVNNATRQVDVVTVGHPATGRIWSARGNEPTVVRHTESNTGPDQPVECHVWKGPFEGGTLLIDHLGAFPGGFNAFGMAELLAALVLEGVKFSSKSSNGFHHALVADQGSEDRGIMASFTSAKGGDWDLAGVLLVLNAGGAAVGLKIVEEGEGKRLVVHDDPRELSACDMLLTANTEDTLRRILGIILDSAFVDDAFAA